MKIYYTRLYNGPNPEKQRIQLAYEAASQAGFTELPLYANPDMNIPYDQLSVQFDGSFAACQHKSSVIIQYPTGMGSKYDRLVIEEVRSFSSKAILNIIDSELLRESLNDDEQIALIDSADAVIVGDSEVKRLLDTAGTDKSKRIYREPKRKETMETQVLNIKSYFDAIVFVQN